MEQNEAKKLVAAAKPAGPLPAAWADLGCGEGFFTQVLAELLPAGSRIFAVDRVDSFRSQTERNGVSVAFRQADFTTGLPDLPPLDGILMANALHYVENKPALIDRLRAHLKKDGVFLIVEYENVSANRWVPYPVAFENLRKLFGEKGFQKITRLGETASAYGGKLYAALIEP